MNVNDGSVIDRRAFLQGTFVGATALASERYSGAADASDIKAVEAQIERHHDEALHRLQEWIRQPSIVAENRGMTEGCDLTMRLLRDAGFDQVTKVPTRAAVVHDRQRRHQFSVCAGTGAFRIQPEGRPMI